MIKTMVRSPRVVSVSFLFFGLLILYLFIGKKTPIAQTGSLETVHVLNLGRGEEITGMVLMKPQEVIQVDKVQGEWRIMRPVQDRAETVIVDGLVTALKTTIREQNLTAGEVAIEETGLKEPAMKLEIKMAPQGKQRALLFGSKAAIGDRYYARWADEDQVFIVALPFVKAFDRTTYSLRKKNLFLEQNSSVKEIRIQNPHGFFTLEREAGSWRFKGDPSKKVDSRTVEDWLTELSGLYVKEFLDGLDPRAPRFGLYPIQSFIRIGLGQEGEKPWMLLIGSEVQEREGIYVGFTGETRLFIVSALKVNKLMRKERHFYWRYFIPLEVLRMSRLSIDEGPSQWSFRRTEGYQWEEESPVGGEAASSEDLSQNLGRLLMTLKDIKYEKVLSEEEARSLFLVKSDLQFHFYDREGNNFLDCEIYRKEDRLFVILSTNRRQVYEVDDGYWEEIGKYMKGVLGEV